MKRKLNPFEVAYDQYLTLKERLRSTRDVQEKNVLFKRLTNLLAVMEFLISLNKSH